MGHLQSVGEVSVVDETQISSGSTGPAAPERVTAEIVEEPINWLDVPFTEYQVSDGILTLILVFLVLGSVLSLVRRFM